MTTKVLLPYDILRHIHGFLDIPLRRKFESALGWPVTGIHKLPKPDIDLLALKTSFIKNDPNFELNSFHGVELVIVLPISNTGAQSDSEDEDPWMSDEDPWMSDGESDSDTEIEERMDDTPTPTRPPKGYWYILYKRQYYQWERHWKKKTWHFESDDIFDDTPQNDEQPYAHVFDGWWLMKDAFIFLTRSVYLTCIGIYTGVSHGGRRMDWYREGMYTTTSVMTYDGPTQGLQLQRNEKLSNNTPVGGLLVGTRTILVLF